MKQIPDERTPLFLAVASKSKKIFEIYWNFLLKYLKDEKLKKFLLKVNYNGISALHRAAIKDDKNFFKFFLDFHLDLFEREELREIFKEQNEFLHKMILNSNLSNCKAIATLVEVLWAGEKMKLREFLMQTDESIFAVFKNQEVYREKLKPFVKLFRGTFDTENEEEINRFNEIVRWDEGFESKFEEKD